MQLTGLSGFQFFDYVLFLATTKIKITIVFLNTEQMQGSFDRWIWMKHDLFLTSPLFTGWETSTRACWQTEFLVCLCWEYGTDTNLSFWVCGWNFKVLLSTLEATEQYALVRACGVLVTVFYRLVVTTDSVGVILKCQHSNESYKAELSWGLLV